MGHVKAIKLIGSNRDFSPDWSLKKMRLLPSEFQHHVTFCNFNFEKGETKLFSDRREAKPKNVSNYTHE